MHGKKHANITSAAAMAQPGRPPLCCQLELLTLLPSFVGLHFLETQLITPTLAQPSPQQDGAHQ